MPGKALEEVLGKVPVSIEQMRALNSGEYVTMARLLVAGTRLERSG